MEGGITVAKPDNRADNETHLQQHIENTKANMQEAEQYLNEMAARFLILGFELPFPVFITRSYV